MCSQPPRRVNDDYIIDQIATCIPALPKNLREIGFTGGEPTLLGDRFIRVLELCREHLPDTAVHVLTNGRSFSRPDWSRSWASVEHPDLIQSDERRVGKECVSEGRSRWSPSH